jgi:hypothetical protein
LNLVNVLNTAIVYFLCLQCVKIFKDSLLQHLRSCVLCLNVELVRLF